MHVLSIVLAAATLLAMLVRPFRRNPAWWAAGGAVLLAATGALSVPAALGAMRRGVDVYLFLIGMMALAEFARAHGVFAWLAARAVRAAAGSRSRLLLLVYGTGVATTAFLSNDATIVVLTPAVLEALALTDADPVPYAIACALVANAASLTLPIANPSNLVFFAGRMPTLSHWFGSFGWASIAAVVLTFAALALVFRREVAAPLVRREAAAPVPPPRVLGVVTLAVAVAALVVTSSLGGPLGLVTCGLGAVATLLTAGVDRGAAAAIVRGIAWPIVALTAGLFVVVDALDLAGAAALPRETFAWAAHLSGPLGQVGVAAATAFASNVANNLPVGLDVGKYVAAAHPPEALGSAALVGVNVGPNFSLGGSLATLLWIGIVHRAGVPMTPLRFAKIGLLVTPAALIGAALLAR
ncbi:MAG: arsenic transporter [Candidatus Eremiobacteraeota bacterium]|nr:arsenic transporter [Candidatus Eremiobacteraeota bacterium]